jgi:hypothetical protein
MTDDEQHVSVDSNLFLTHSRLESLPNELLFMSMVRLSSPDLVHAFFGLNHRFDLIVCHLARHFTISENTLEIGFDRYKPDIINAIEKIRFDVQLLPQIFLSTHLYSSIHAVVLSCSNFVTVDLNVNCDSAKNTIDACLDVLQACQILPVDFDNENSFSPKNDRSKSEEILNRLVCSAIVRLSIDSCSEQALISLCAVTPNLTYLKVKQLVSTDDDSTSNSVLSMIPQLSSLKQLHIAATTNRLNDIHWVGRLIGCYQSSLEYLTLEISLNNRVDGYQLERILEPCQRLQKLAFAFNYLSEETEEIDALHQFQTDWWLDSHRPPVLVLCGNHRETLVVSMPCYLDDYLWFPVDPKDWLVNKGQLDSPNICFTKQKCIRFVNNNRHPITLDLVYIIGHVFRAPLQELSIPHWGFLSPDLLIKQVSFFSHFPSTIEK